MRFKQRVRELTGRTRGISMEQMTKELSNYLRGWKSYFGFAETPSVLGKLDQWIRRRMRSVIWKQWKRGKGRFEEASDQGVGRASGCTNGRKPHGPWRIANSPGHEVRVSQCLLRSAWTASVVHLFIAQSNRTAGCGPACPVVWQGRRGDSPPYADWGVDDRRRSARAWWRRFRLRHH